MKHLLILAVIILSTVVFFTRCSNESESRSFENITTFNSSENSFANDPLIISLTTLNDSLSSVAKIKCVKTRGWRDFVNLFKFIEVVFADVYGGIKGAQWGAIGGPVGSVAGAAIVGIGASAIVGINNFGNHTATRESDTYAFSQSQVETAYVYAKQNETLKQIEIENCSPIDIKVPDKFQSSKNVGLYHNIALKILEKEIPTESEHELDKYLSEEEMSILHSNSFMNKYETLLTNPELISIEYINENSQKEEHIIKLFLEIYQEYAEDITDVNYLINKYIERIENDPEITDLQKQCVYSALSIAAYSTNYWSNK